MPPRFDLYVHRTTWVHGLDPRIKLLFVAEATLLLYLWPTLWAVGGMLGACALLCWQAQVSRSRVCELGVTLAPLLLLVFTLTALFTPVSGQLTWFHLGPVAVTAGSLRLGLLLALRLLVLALIVALWLFTTDQAAMVRGFVALGMPHSWGVTLALALRYLPILAGLFEQVAAAQQARGLDLGQGHFWQRLRLHEPILVAMIILAVRQSEQLGWALEARALGTPGLRRTTFRPLHLARRDWLCLALLGLLLAVAAGLRVL